jgi:hypothetical protein
MTRKFYCCPAQLKVFEVIKLKERTWEGVKLCQVYDIGRDPRCFYWVPANKVKPDVQRALMAADKELKQRLEESIRLRDELDDKIYRISKLRSGVI